MDAADFAASIRFALSQRPAAGGRVEIVLDLFLGAMPALQRTLASVEPGLVGAVANRCRAHLEARGAHAVVHAAAEPLLPRAVSWVYAG